MKVKTVEPVGSFGPQDRKLPDDLPQVAFTGRSNVGKSSLINRLLGRKKLAAISSSPGKTRRIHFYRINDLFYLVDLPGYGFIRLPVALREQWQAMVERSLGSNGRLAGVVCLVDIRREPADIDRRMLLSLAQNNIPLMIALTKADKLSRTRQLASARSLIDFLGGAVTAEQIITTSATTGLGCAELLDEVETLVERVQQQQQV
ncbi:MAG TPA: ribosome biogenesis GTP-binding protein YihA/YsxC [Candidatus Glassbacteria bacterium]|nr:ribosome biogenesis GTP-binding protein YihA/YsxC [Candidatus Glassbacteria bacterium]